MQILPLNYGIEYLKKSKKQVPLQFLKVNLKNGFHKVVDFTKHMWRRWILYNKICLDGNPSVTFLLLSDVKLGQNYINYRNKFSDEKEKELNL